MNPIVQFFNENFPLTISLYCLLLISVVIITTLLSRLCVILKEKTHLSDGVVAGILLGVITSLPELVTCIASIVIHKNGSAGFGDIIGSNFFDLFVLGICLLICVWVFIKYKVNKVNFTTLICTGVGTIFVLLAMVSTQYIPALVWHGFNFFSILILGSYATSIFFLIKNNKVKTENVNEGLTEIKQARKSKLFQLKLPILILLIVIVSLILILCAVFLSFTSESLIYYHWSSVFGTEEKATFGGALLLGIITSLPEVVCCINLCMNKEYNMVIDTIVGSTSFNLAILAIANIPLAIVYQPGADPAIEMYGWSTLALIQVALCLIVICLFVAYLFVNSKKVKMKLNPKQTMGINIALLSLVAISYLVFLILGFLK